MIENTTPACDSGRDDKIWSREELLRAVAAQEALLREFQARPLSQLPIFERIGVLVTTHKKLTCNKCGRVWLEPLLEKIITTPDGKVCRAPTEMTVHWCSHCLPPKRQLVEGDTFRPGGLKRMGRGKLVRMGLEHSEEGEDTEWEDGEFTQLALNSWYCQDLAERNRISRMETIDGESMYSPKNLATARAILQRLSLGQIVQRWPWLSREDARKGKASILELSTN